jgi:hypothetical protein
LWSRNSKNVQEIFKSFDCQQRLAAALINQKPGGVGPAKLIDSTKATYGSKKKPARV